jgi:hypothetical protein
MGPLKIDIVKEWKGRRLDSGTMPDRHLVSSRCMQECTLSVSYESQCFHLNSKHDLTSEAEAGLTRIQMLRDEIVTAWRERGIMLTKSEQDRLHAEIVDTCKLLTDLTLTK